MNYCSIQEAWGQNDHITKQYKRYNNPYEEKVTNKKTLEKFSSSEKKFKKHISKINNCDDFIKHLDKCKKCQTALRNKYSPKILENFSDMVENNRDIVVLILVGISIMLFFNLIKSV